MSLEFWFVVIPMYGGRTSYDVEYYQKGARKFFGGDLAYIEQDGSFNFTKHGPRVSLKHRAIIWKAYEFFVLERERLIALGIDCGSPRFKIKGDTFEEIAANAISTPF